MYLSLPHTASSRIPAAIAQAKPGRLPLAPLFLDRHGQRWIQINLSRQTLTAYQGTQAVRTMPISSGVVPRWTTPSGTFWIYRKVAIDRMRGQDLETGEHWDVARVPWAQYFKGGIAIHGAWWRHHFGTPKSHGCIQLPTRTFNPDPDHTVDDAHWLYQFTRVGTLVKIVGTTPASMPPIPSPRGSSGLTAPPSDARSDASSIR
jgi:lipoprotein-anchoring transpeptidase ErfK/SrfK